MSESNNTTILQGWVWQKHVLTKDMLNQVIALGTLEGEIYKFEAGSTGNQALVANHWIGILKVKYGTYGLDTNHQNLILMAKFDTVHRRDKFAKEGAWRDME